MLASLRGPKVVGPMAPELPIQYPEGTLPGTVASVPVADIKRRSRDSDEGREVAATH
jgi:hypothetical protein